MNHSRKEFRGGKKLEARQLKRDIGKMLITPYIILFGIESHDRLLVIEEQRGRQEKTISRRDEKGGWLIT